MSGITHVRQPVSLQKDYTVGKVDGGGKLGGHEAVTDSGAAGKASHVKTTWERFTSRAKQRNSRFVDAFCNNDKTADRRAERFNARHEVFSTRIKNLVGDLRSGKGGSLADKDFMATLRNDVKHLQNDAPWAGRPNLLEARLDVELVKLTDHELGEMAKALKDADRSRLTSKDKADLATMQKVVIKHQLARSSTMGNVLAAINKDHPEDTSGKDTLKAKIDLAQMKVKADGVTAGLQYKTGEQGEAQKLKDQMDIVGGAMRLRLQSEGHDAATLGAFNRNLLNVERAFVKAGTTSSKHSWEVAEHLPVFRATSRAVRQEFLKTKVGDINDDNLKTRMKVLGAGAAHEVTKGTYELSGKLVGKVHKYDDEELNHPHGGRFAAPERLGIDQSNPRLLERAVITSEIDKRLGFNVCVGTDFALHHGEVGIVMDLAKGTTGHDAHGIETRDGALLKDLTKLQLLDCLTGQADRHGGNYMVDFNRDGTVNGAKAIDSDFSMGPHPSDPKDIVGKHGVHLRGLPPVIDTDMRKAILAMKESDIDDIARDMLDDDSVKAAKDRLKVMQAYVQGSEVTVIAPDEWSKKDVMDKFTKDNSYWARDLRHFEYIGFD